MTTWFPYFPRSASFAIDGIICTSLTVVLSRYIGRRKKHTRFYVSQKNRIATLLFRTMTIPPPPPHHLDHGEYHRNTGSVTIALTATSLTTILPLGLVKVVVLPEKLHCFYHANFVTRQPSWLWGGKMGFQCRFIFKSNPLPFSPLNH